MSSTANKRLDISASDATWLGGRLRLGRPQVPSGGFIKQKMPAVLHNPGAGRERQAGAPQSKGLSAAGRQGSMAGRQVAVCPGATSGRRFSRTTRVRCRRPTSRSGVDVRTRRRLIGNGWRWGVAARLLCVLVAHTFTARASAAWTLPATPRTSATAGAWCGDMVRPATVRPVLEPAWEFLTSCADSCGTTSTASGRRSRTEVQQLIDDSEDDL